MRSWLSKFDFIEHSALFCCCREKKAVCTVCWLEGEAVTVVELKLDNKGPTERKEEEEEEEEKKC